MFVIKQKKGYHEHNFNIVPQFNIFDKLLFFNFFCRTNSESLEEHHRSSVKISTSTHSSSRSTPTDTLEEEEEEEGSHPSNDNSFDTGFEPAQYADIDATNENIFLASARVAEVVLESSKPMSVCEKISTQEYTHNKNSSTDNAVHIPPEEQHANTPSNEIELHDVSINCLKPEAFNETVEELSGHHENENEVNTHQHHENEVNTEKEKPQRTINRRKKDCGPVSRNSSCVSTDSTTSTATVDSGIVMRLDSSPRTSPISSDQYYNHKDLSTSRETLDDDVKALEESEMNNSPSYYDNHDLMKNSSMLDSGTHSENFEDPSTDIEDLDTEKVYTICCTLIVETITRQLSQDQKLAKCLG